MKKEIILTANAEKILKARYYQDGEYWEDMCRRVVHDVAGVEYIYGANKATINSFEEKFFDMMYAQDFVPSSPVLMNAGTDNPQLAACFVLGIEDSIESIFDTLGQSAAIFKSGGGVGYDFSKLRPTDTQVGSTKGVASGPISFMELFDKMTATIKAGGKRRGATMGVLRCDHENILDFIKCKDSSDSINNFNISVALTDEFMDDEYLETSTIFNALVHQAWKNGEPGVLFIDNANATNPTPHIGDFACTNPCQPADAPILDGDCISRIDSVKHTCTSQYTAMKNVLELKLNNGMKLRFTPDHKIMGENGEWIMAKDSLNAPLKWGLGDRRADIFYENNIINGFLFGDGYKCGGGIGCSVKLNGEKEFEIYNMLVDYGFNTETCGNLYINRDDLDFTSDFLNQKLPNRALPRDIFYAESNRVGAFLMGLFEANGSVSINGQISLKATCLSMVEDVQILLATFGIPAWITPNKARDV